MDVFIPTNLLSGTGYFVLYMEGYSGANDGFEEWRFNSKAVPEPATAPLLLSGLAALGLFWRMRPN